MCALSFGAQDWALQTTAGGEDIHAAAAAGSIARVQHLLAQGVSIEARNVVGETPLFVAVTNKRTALVSWLLAKGADKNATDFGGRRAVAVAFEAKDAAIVGLLAEAGVDVNTDKLLARIVRFDGYGRCDDVEMVKALLRSPSIDPHLSFDGRATVHHDPWQIAVASNNRACVQAFLDRREATRLRVNNGPVLHIAVDYTSNVALVDLLLAVPGIDPNMGEPVFLALKKGHLPIVRSLLGHPAVDPNAGGSETLLGLAVKKRSREAVELMLEFGSDVDVRTARNPVNRGLACVTPLMVAAGLGYDELAELLITRGADVNAADCDRNYGDVYRPLAWVAEGGNSVTTARLLVAHGALVNVPDSDADGQPLCVAQRYSRTALVDYLKSVGASCG